MGTRPPRQGQCFSLGLKEGVGFNPRVNFDGERKVSPSAGSPPCLRTTVPRPHHQLPSPLQLLRRKRPLRSSAPCLLSIEVGRRVVRRPKERRAGSDLPRRQGHCIWRIFPGIIHIFFSSQKKKKREKKNVTKPKKNETILAA